MTQLSEASPETLDPRLADLVAQMTDRAQAGEPIDLDACLREHPQYAERLRALFPALRALLDVGQETPGLPADPEAGKVLGDYHILRTLGRGGMGVVYEAVQRSLGRHVALKVLPPQSAAEPTYLERFQREAQAAARLHHTNIVPVFGVGESEGVHFYAMQFIDGEGLDVVLARRRQRRGAVDRSAPTPPPSAPLTPPVGDSSGKVTAPDASAVGSTVRDCPVPSPGEWGELAGLAEPASRDYFRSVARVGLQVAEALDYAHDRGVLHRDIKPSNLLLDRGGVVWVTDFGLAKVAGAGELTGSGMLVGTLRYMAPERFSGHSDQRSDVYSLAATLYELLTLRPAFDRQDPVQLIQEIAHDSPPRPRKVEPAVPRDLETIVLKGLDRLPEGRYASAGAMADDLRRFLADQPILARKHSWPERLQRWCRRNPAASAAILATLAAAVLSVVFAVNKVWDNQTLAENLRQKEIAETDLRKFNRLGVRMALERGLRACEMGRVREGLLWMARGLKHCPADAPELEFDLRANLASWGSTVRLPLGVLEHEGQVQGLFVSPDGRALATTTSDDKLHLWDLANERLIGPPIPHTRKSTGVAFSPDGSRLATCSTPGGIRVWQTQTAEALGEVLEPSIPISQLAWAPDGNTLAGTTTSGLCLWNVPTGKSRMLTQFQSNRSEIAFTPDGKTLLLACILVRRPTPEERRQFAGPGLPGLRIFDPTEFVEGWELTAWDVATGQRRAPPLSLAHATADFLAFTADRTTAVTGRGRVADPLKATRTARALQFWRVDSGKPTGSSHAIARPTIRLGLTPDDKVVMAGLLGEVEVLDWRSGQRRGLGGFSRRSDLQAISPDGKTALTDRSGLYWADHALMFRDLATGGAVEAMVYHSGGGAAAFSPDGQTVFAGDERFVRIWAASAPPERWLSRKGGPPATGFHVGGQTVATRGGVEAQVWDAGSGRPRTDPLIHSHPLTTASVSLDDRALVTANVRGEVAVWDIPSGKLRFDPLQAPPPVTHLHITADGRAVCAVGKDNRVHRWNAVTGESLGDPLPHDAPVKFLASGADGVGLWTATASGVQFWDVWTGRSLREKLARTEVVALCAERTGSKLLVASGGGRLWLWDRESDRPNEWSVEAPLVAAALSADGRRILTLSSREGEQQGQLQAWDVASGRKVGRVMPIERPSGLAASPDGRFALAVDGDGRMSGARLWDLETGQPLGPANPHSPSSGRLAFTADGQSFVTVGVGQPPHVWSVPTPISGSVDRLLLWAHVLTGQELDEGGAVQTVDAETWHERRRQLDALGGPPLP